MDNHRIIETADGFRSGYCAILGRPNVGKSTLLNAIIGEKIAIVTDKPQTTRDRLAGIYTDDRRQIVFVDTPGVIDPRDRFNEYLLREAREGIEEVDAVLHLLDAAERNSVEPVMEEVLKTVKAPVFLVINKIDAAPKNFDPDSPTLGAPGIEYARRFAVSALTGEGVKDLVEAIGDELPEGFPFYDPEQICDRDLRYLVAERVREKVFDLLRQEAPYAVATQVDEFREQPDQKKTYINVNIFVERDSQKGLVIGAGGRMIKRIGQEARGEIEELLGGPVFLELGVKVRKKWRKQESALREFGYATAAVAAGRKHKHGRKAR